MDFGYINGSKHSEDLTYVALTSVASNSALWAFKWSGYAIGNGAFNQTSSIVVAVDTGIPYARLPPSIASSYYAEIKGSSIEAQTGLYIFPCDGTRLQNFTFGVGSTKFVVPAEQLDSTLLAISDATDATCYGSIQSSGDEGKGSLGVPFLAGIYTVFDYGLKQLGFASANLTSASF